MCLLSYFISIVIASENCCTKYMMSDLDEIYDKKPKPSNVVAPCLEYGHGYHFGEGRICACVLKQNAAENETNYKYERCCDDCKPINHLMALSSRCAKNETFATYRYASVFFNIDENGTKTGLLPITALPNTKIYRDLELDCECNIIRSSNQGKPYIYDHLLYLESISVEKLDTIDKPCKNRLKEVTDRRWSCSYIAKDVQSLEYCERFRDLATKETIYIGKIIS